MEEFSVRKGWKGMGVFQDCLEENKAFLGNDIHKIDGMFYRTMERVMVMVVWCGGVPQVLLNNEDKTLPSGFGEN